jgi:alpha-tubulin suppressor-like RCC1 family protein
MEIKIKILKASALLWQATLAAICLTLLASISYAQTPQVSVGDDYGAMIDEYGNLFVWGAIEGGSGDIEQILPAESWESVAVSRTAADDAHILAIRTNGTLWAWGSNDRGQLGDGTQIDREDPVQIGSETNWMQVAVGEDFSLGLRDNGLLFAWGDNSYGQLGYGPIYNDTSIDIKTSPGSPFDDSYIAISAGNAHAHGIQDDGTLWAWGSGGSATGGGYELGTGDLEVGAVLPVKISQKDGWTALFSGYSVTYGIRDSAKQTGQLWVWGSGAYLGDGSSLAKSPTRIGSGTGWASVSRGTEHTLALKSNGNLWGWGMNYADGELGLALYDSDGNYNSSNTSKSTPVRLEEDDTFLAVGAGVDFSAIVRSDGFLLTAGSNSSGQLANGSNLGTGQDHFETSSLGIADLSATSLSLSTTTPTPDSTITATLTLTNEGTGLIDADFQVAAAMSTTTSYDDGTPLVMSSGDSYITVTDDIASGDSLSVTLYLEIPADVDLGNYYFVVKADSSDVVDETDEDNNTVATDDTYDFLPDLTVSSGGLVVINEPSDGNYDPSTTDTIDIELEIENSGNGTLSAGSEFDIRIFLTPERSDDNSEIIELEEEEVVALTEDLLPGEVLDTLSFSYEVPSMPAGSYYVAVTLDVNDDVEEQPEITDDNDIVTQEDGEENNTSYTSSMIVVTGLTIKEAIDQDASSLVFSTSGDGEWFGQSSISNDGVDSVQSPSLDVGETASFSTSFSTPVAITFDWSSDTSSSENRAYFQVVNGVTGGSDNEISGDSGGWTEGVARVVPASGRAEWVYEQGVEGTDDAVYVDNLQYVEIDEPDLVIDDIYLAEDATGSYTLMSDRLDLTVNSRNQGVSTSSTENYVLSIYLSTDSTFDRPDTDDSTADDILIRQVTVTDSIEEGDDAVNALSISLDTDIDPGDYYVIGYIDDYTDESGSLITGTTTGIGGIEEFTDVVGSGDAFPGEDNNVFISDEAMVTIVTLPDLEVTSLESSPTYYYITDPDSGYEDPNSVSLSFSIANTGLAAVYDTIGIKALFSKDEVIEADSDYALLDYDYENYLSAVEDEPANERTINPGEVDFRDNLIDEGYIGERLYLGIYVDSDEAIEELDEDNNTYKLSDNNYILSELTIADGLDLSDSTISDLNIVIDNDEVAPYDSDEIPWVGQTSETFDGVDAVASVIVDDNETSSFSVEINPTTAVRVSFRWKVSSQNEEVAGTTQKDVLSFLVNGEALDDVPDIFGSDDSTWQRVELTLDAGEQILTWSYTKDDEGSDGDDRGWVDQLSINELPNLEVSAITVDGSLTYQAGDTLDDWSVTIVNDGDTIEAGTEFDVQVRLLSSADWDDSDALTLLTITDDDGIEAGETRVYNSDSNGVLTLLDTEDYTAEYYYLGAYVDWSSADPDDGQISESDETDNYLFTDEASIQLGLPDLTGTSSSVSGLESTGYLYGDAVELSLDLTNSGDGVLEAGASFNYTLYISRTNDELLFDSASVVELGEGSVTVAADVASGADLAQIDFSGTMPYGLAVGSYYLAVVIDSDDDIEEQGLSSDGTGVDGEENNLFYTSLASFYVDGVSLQDALDDGNSTITLGDFENDTDGDAYWFGRYDAGSNDSDDDQTFEGGEGAQSPDLELGDYAAFSLDVVDSSLVRFQWGVSSSSDLNILSVLVNGEVYEYEGETYQISGNVDLAEVDPAVLVPAGGTIEWRYTKGADTEDDYAIVDNVRVDTNDQPDLLITALTYTAGEYVLDVAGFTDDPDTLLGTEYLDITVEATNQGEDVVATSFTVADIEVRLSTDQEWGNSDDIVLGSFSELEGDLLSGDLIRFLGPIQLGDSIPENTYYLMARIDSNDELTEFSEDNNIMISDDRDITVTRLPALRIANPISTAVDGVFSTAETNEDMDGVNFYLDPKDVDNGNVAVDLNENLLYYAESTMSLSFDIQNIGLGQVDSDQEWTTEVNLRGILRADVADADAATDPVDSFIDAVDPTINLGSFTVQELMEGRSELNPDGDSVSIDVEFALPNGARLNDIVEEDTTYEDYLWFIEILIDSEDELEESEIIKESTGLIAPTGLPWWIINIQEILDTDTYLTSTNTDDADGAFGISDEISSMDAATWELLYPGYSTTDEEYLLAYAFNRDPSSGDTASNQFPGSYGVTTIDGEDYLSITFDIVTRATDLTYVVEAADNVLFTTNQVDLLSIDVTNSTGFVDSTGSASLTGDGGLIDEENVVTVTDEGYSASITVQDEQAVGTSSTRFIRISVGGTAASAVSSD